MPPRSFRELAEERAAFFKRQREAHPQLSSKITTLDDLFERKLWHQLTNAIMELIDDAAFKTGQDLVDMYSHFVKHFASKLNQLSLVQIAIRVSAQYTDATLAKEFLKEILQEVAGNEEAKIVCQMALARIHLNDNSIEDCKALLDEAGKHIEGASGLDSVVQSSYYGVLTQFHKRKESAMELYKSALLYLAFTPIESIPPAERLVLAVDMSVAALLGEKIYNFGELLAHPVFASLQGSPYEWLAGLVTVFNGGDIVQFEALSAAHAAQIHAIPALVAAAPLIRQKVTILSLIELAFRQPADGDRSLSFAAIAQHSRLPENEVEMLVMKALSVGLVKGRIDQVKATVRLHWVQPRVLDRSQMAALGARLAGWSSRVQQSLLFLENESPELVA